MMIILRGVLLREMVGLEGSTVCLKFDLYPCRKNQRCYLRSSLGGHTYSLVRCPRWRLHFLPHCPA